MKRNAPVGRGWVIRGCLAGALVLSNVGCGPRLVRPPLPLADSDAAHQDRATITAISVESVSLIGPAMCPNAFYLMPQDRQCSCLQCTGKTGAWNVRLNLEISATTPQLVEEIAHECWYYLFEEGGRFVWITRSNGRDLWLGGAPEFPPGMHFSYRNLKPDEITRVAPDRYTATIPVSIASYELPSGEVTIAFDGEAMRKVIGHYGVPKTIPEGGIYCPAATVMAPAPTPTRLAKRAAPQSGAGIGSSP